MKKNLIISLIIVLVLLCIFLAIFLYMRFPLKNISKDTPFEVVIQESPSNFGHTNLINKVVKFPEKSIHEYNVYDNSDPAIDGLKRDFLYLTEVINQNIDYIEPVNNLFKLYKYTAWREELPKHTKEPTLVMSLFKPNLDKKDALWASRYFAAQLKMMLVFNHYFPNGSIRAYLDYFMLESFKNYSLDDLQVGSLVENPTVQFEIKQYDNNRLFRRFDKFMAENPGNLKNGYEKFMYYYSIASKIVNDTDSDDDIRNHKSGDFFIYKFSGNFTEIINGMTSHVSNGYMGQLMRYVCLRQSNYQYKKWYIRRNTHFVWRDGHENQPSPNDIANMYHFNKACKHSDGKVFNMLPCDQYYKAPWHSFVNCPADPSQMVIRSAIAGVVQMCNFRDTDYWLPDEIYYKTIGMAFLLDNEAKITLRYHRPLSITYDAGKKRTFGDYGYGIEEYLFNTLFYLEYFQNKNVYYPDRFLWDVWMFSTPNGLVSNELVSNERPITKATLILFLYLVRNNKLGVKFTALDFLKEVENLRNNPPKDSLEKKWLGYILAIFPTKYFIQSTIFNKGFQARNGGFVPPELVQIDRNDIVQRVSAWGDFDIYNTDMSKWTWERMNRLQFMTCNTPILNSNVEWCTEPYINMPMCPSENFFSGFYGDRPGCLKYGMFRQPSEIKDVIECLESSDDLILYKNFIHQDNKGLRALAASGVQIQPSSVLLNAQDHTNWQNVFDAAHMFE